MLLLPFFLEFMALAPCAALLASQRVHVQPNAHALDFARRLVPLRVHIDEGFSDEDDYWFEQEDGDDGEAAQPSRYIAEPLRRSVAVEFLAKWKDSRIAADSVDAEK